MMEVASGASTPQNTDPSRVERRSFTAPSKSRSSPNSTFAIRQAETEDAETLFAHHACKIVSFQTSSPLWRRHSSVASRGSEVSNEPIGVFPWASATETTKSTGPLRIYRVRGSVAFLSSGNTLRPILSRSQCWCVDGESKFVIPIGDQSYYRIELPNKYPEEITAIEEFKAVLDKILKYEKTPCPFKRGFTVELPEPPKTPVRIKPWKPRERPPSQSSSPRKKLDDQMVKTKDHADFQGFESLETSSNGTVVETSGNVDAGPKYVDPAGASMSKNSNIGEYVRESGVDLRNTTRANHMHVAICETLAKTTKIEAARAVTAPPHIVFQANPSFKSTSTTLVPSNLQSKHENEPVSLSSSADSFHSFHSPISPLPPSPPYSNPSSPSPKLEKDYDFVVPRTRTHQRDLPETTFTSERSEIWELTMRTEAEDIHSSTPTVPKTPTLVSDDASQSEDIWPDVETPSPLTQLRQRRALSRRSTPSPLPSPANMYSPSCRLSGHHLTTAILQKTCSILLGPPVQLVALMLNIASKIAKGTFRGAAYGHNESGQRIPCSWNFSDSEDDMEPAWDEDDYGVSLGKGIGGTRQEPTQEVGGTWEID